MRVKWTEKVRTSVAGAVQVSVRTKVTETEHQGYVVAWGPEGDADETVMCAVVHCDDNKIRTPWAGQLTVVKTVQV